MLRPSLRALAAVAIGLIAARASAALPEIPPAPTRWVTDKAGLLSSATRESLDARLEAYERTTGRQVLVYVDRTTGGLPIEDFAVRAFEKWRVGRKGIDDGLVLFVFAEDLRLRIEVGYGLEGTVPDALAGRIVRDTIAPRLAEGRADEALAAGVEAMLAAASAEEGAPPGIAAGPSAGTPERPLRREAARPLSLGQKVLVGILVLGFIVLLITNPQLAIWLLINVLASGRGGGGFGGGGGRSSFGGGGGRSGGGGASGSW